MGKLENNNVSIRYNPETKEFTGEDKLDSFNLPAFYNTTKRSTKKAWEALQKDFSESTTCYQAINILINNGVAIKSYCMMD